jgi:hypothetical protein
MGPNVIVGEHFHNNVNEVTVSKNRSHERNNVQDINVAFVVAFK